MSVAMAETKLTRTIRRAMRKNNLQGFRKKSIVGRITGSLSSSHHKPLLPKGFFGRWYNRRRMQRATSSYVEIQWAIFTEVNENQQIPEMQLRSKIHWEHSAGQTAPVVRETPVEAETFNLFHRCCPDQVCVASIYVKHIYEGSLVCAHCASHSCLCRIAGDQQNLRIAQLPP